MNVAKKDLKWLFNDLESQRAWAWDMSNEGRNWDEETEADFLAADAHFVELRKKYLGDD